MWQLWDITFDLIQRRALNIHPMQMAMLGTVWGHEFFLFRDYLALFNAWWIKNPGLSNRQLLVQLQTPILPLHYKKATD